MISGLDGHFPGDRVGHVLANSRHLEREASALWRDTEWLNLRAVREGRVYLIDGNQYFSRPGPRLADSLEIMAEILHPEVFTPSLQGSAWKPLEF